MKRMNGIIKCVFSTGLICSVILIFASCSFMGSFPLDTPKNITVVSVTENSVVVKWDPVPNARDYEVHVTPLYTGEGGAINFAYTETTELNNLDWDEMHEISVKALATHTVWDRFCDGECASITFKTLMPGAPEGEYARPANLKAEYKDGSVSLTWDKVEGAPLYEVSCNYYDSDNGWDNLYYDRTQVLIDGSKNYFCDNAIKEGNPKVCCRETTKICYRVCVRDEKVSERERYWSKKFYLKIQK